MPKLLTFLTLGFCPAGTELGMLGSVVTGAGGELEDDISHRHWLTDESCLLSYCWVKFRTEATMQACLLSTVDCSPWLVKCGRTAARSEVVQWLVSGSQDSADEAHSAWLHVLLGTKRNYSYTLLFFPLSHSPAGFFSHCSDTPAFYWICCVSFTRSHTHNFSLSFVIILYI